MSKPTEWQALWSRVRGIHSSASSYRVHGLSSSGSIGRSSPAEERAFALTHAAGQRLLLVVGKPGQEQAQIASAAGLVWGTPEQYFAWRPSAGVESLKGDFKLACSRCALTVPRIHEVLELLSGRDLSIASPHASRPEEVNLTPTKHQVGMSWVSDDGITKWEAALRSDDAALLELRSATDPDFDLERALAVACQGLKVQPSTDQRERLRSQLSAERQEPRWHRLLLKPNFDVDLDQATFQVAPPRP